MPDPLDYFNAKPSHNPPPESAPQIPAAAKPIAVWPVEFDVLLIRSEDHAGMRAIEAALLRANIKSFRMESDARAHRTIELRVQHADHPAAAEIADVIVRRRAKINSFPRQKPLADPPGGDVGPRINW